MTKPLAENSRDVLAYIDESKPVHAYRNLHRKCLSVKQGGLVKCHVENVVLKDATFVVSEKGRERVRKEKQKNVHAYVKGTVVDARDTDHLPSFWDDVHYNPYECDHFESLGKDGQRRYVDSAEWVDVDGNTSGNVSAILAYGLGYKNA